MDRNICANNHIRIREVALRKESVDRNSSGAKADSVSKWVALRKESVDRNRISGHLVGVYFVALRKESVDRNSVTRRRVID